MKGQGGDHKQETEGSPFSNFSGIDILIVCRKNEVNTDRDSLLVQTDLRMRVEDTEFNQCTRFD